MGVGVYVYWCVCVCMWAAYNNEESFNTNGIRIPSLPAPKILKPTLKAYYSL